MPLVRAGAASLPDPSLLRGEDRIACGEHAWVVLAGTPNESGGANEADVALPMAEALVRSPSAPSTDEVIGSLLDMDRAVRAWERSSEDLWGTSLGVVVLVLDDDALRIAHVGEPRAWQLSAALGDARLAVTRLTTDHTLRESGWRAGGAGGEGPADALLSSVGQSPIARIDVARVPLRAATRLVLTSPGAHWGLATPLGYLWALRSPVECAQRLCAEARARAIGAGDRPRHRSAIVVDVDPEPSGGPYR